MYNKGEWDRVLCLLQGEYKKGKWDRVYVYFKVSIIKVSGIEFMFTSR